MKRPLPVARGVLVLLCLLVLGPAPRAWSQNARASVHPSTLVAGQSAQLNLAVNGVGAVEAPVLVLPPGLSLRQTSPTMQRNNLNGRLTVHLSWAIRADSVGTHTIAFPPLKSGTRMIQPPALAVKVFSPDDLPRNEYGALAGSEVFATMSIARTNLYRRQVVDATVTVFVLGGTVIDISLDIPKSMASERTLRQARSVVRDIGGKRYYATPYKFRVWPNAAGTIPVQPDMKVSIRRPQDRFGFFRTSRQVEIRPVKPVVLEVRKFPETNRPESFTEAVGTFSFEASASPNELRVGEPITLQMEIQSTDAVMDPVQPPAFASDQGFKIYPARLIEDRVGPDGVGGRKRYEQVIEPVSDEVSEVPPIAFSYFDPVHARYLEVKKGPYPITVAPAEPSSFRPGALPGALTPEQADQFLYPRRSVSRWHRRGAVAWYLRPVAVAAQLVPLLGFGLCLAAARRRESLRRDVAKARRLRAPRAARAGLAAAEAATDDAGFHEGIWQALTEYFGNRLNLAPGEVESPRVQQAFPGQAEEVATLFAECEASRYGHAAAADRAGQLQRLKTLVRTCEKAEPAT